MTITVSHFFIFILGFFIKQKTDGLQSNIIYNIHTAKNGLIYIAHSKGISSFDGIFFKYYPNKNYPFTELSNILETSNGEIYCKAFNNILYKYKRTYWVE